MAPNPTVCPHRAAAPQNVTMALPVFFYLASAQAEHQGPWASCYDIERVLLPVGLKMLQQRQEGPNFAAEFGVSF